MGQHGFRNEVGGDIPSADFVCVAFEAIGGASWGRSCCLEAKHVR